MSSFKKHIILNEMKANLNYPANAAVNRTKSPFSQGLPIQVAVARSNVVSSGRRCPAVSDICPKYVHVEE